MIMVPRPNHHHIVMIVSLILLLFNSLYLSDAFLSIISTNRASLFSASTHIYSQVSRAPSSSDDDNIISFEVLSTKKVLVVGGSGRVGGSVVTQLLSHGASVVVGGTSADSFDSAKTRWKSLFPDLERDIDRLTFVCVDREDASSFSEVFSSKTKIGSIDLVIHTAGPFQGKAKTPNGVLDAAISNNVPYIDVCDDYCTASAAKTQYMEKAKNSNIACIVSTGCWPGVSSLMAKQLIRKALITYPQLKADELTVDFSFYTAGSGGAGATLLVATFLILAEEALIIVNNRRKTVPAMKEYKSVDFGPRIGYKDIAHLNLLETASVHEILGAGNITTLFGTDPPFWNTLLGLMAQLPPSLLSNEQLMEKLAVFSLPIVRAVDYFPGATNAMRCDISSKKQPDLHLSAIYGHENLEPCVGECVTAFSAAVLAGKVTGGVWFPEEAIEGGTQASRVLQLASVGAHTVMATGKGFEADDGEFRKEVWGL